MVVRAAVVDGGVVVAAIEVDACGVVVGVADVLSVVVVADELVGGESAEPDAVTVDEAV